MIETFKEFKVEVVRSLPPHESLQRGALCITVHLRGEADAVYGWPADLKELDHHIRPLLALLARSHVNEIEGLALPSLENLARWLWERLRGPLPCLAGISVSRGAAGSREGCTYSGRG